MRGRFSSSSRCRNCWLLPKSRPVSSEVCLLANGFNVREARSTHPKAKFLQTRLRFEGFEQRDAPERFARFGSQFVERVDLSFAEQQAAGRCGLGRSTRFQLTWQQRPFVAMA